ncbi:hypothetical protein [Hydrogenophaga sp. ANAO-22]|jgi:hypothetical protein|uniref:hypothetical protein n=1 Tax=Hydrogenophaga sp. ANAO-22 TaxID=3166645 RepID=UPI0036D2962E
MKRSLLCLTLLLAATAHAKLPAPPPPTEEAKAKAAEAAAKTAWAAKVDGYKLCASMDKAAANYFKTAAATGKSVPPATANAPACTDPGPFAYVAPKPVEAAGAHSPPETAKSPPSTNTPAAVTTPAKK